MTIYSTDLRSDT